MSKTTKKIIIIICIIYLIYNIYVNYCERGYQFYKQLFKPSDKNKKMFKELQDYVKVQTKDLNVKTLNFPKVVDFVCMGGGFYNLNAVGAIFVLRELNIKIERFSGASAGSQVSYICMLQDKIEEGFRWCMAAGETIEQYPWMRHQPIWQWFKDVAKRSSIPKPGKLNCSLTIFPKWYNPLDYHNIQVSDYKSQDDVGEAVLASGAIPWFFYYGLY